MVAAHSTHRQAGNTPPEAWPTEPLEAIARLSSAKLSG